MKEKIEKFDEKIEKIDEKIEKIVSDIDIDEKSKKKLKEQMKKEFEDYKKDFLENNIDLDDDKPFLQKLIFIIVGVFFFPIGYALYFLIKDNKKYKWQSNYLIKSATWGLVLSITGVILEIITIFIEIKDVL